MTQSALARCGRTSSIVGALLDGLDTQPADRAHIAACATCLHDSERAVRFTRRLATAAAEAADGIPEPAVARGHRVNGVRIGRLRVRVAPVATLAGAIAAGLVVAAIIGTRAQPPAGQPPNAFTSVATATEALSPLGFICASSDAEAVCRSTAPDHLHLVTLTMAEGRVVEVEARIESTDGTSLDLRGVADLFARISSAVVASDLRAASDRWIRDAYPTCGAGCSSELGDVRVAMAKDGRSVSLSLRER